MTRKIAIRLISISALALIAGVAFFAEAIPGGAQSNLPGTSDTRIEESVTLPSAQKTGQVRIDPYGNDAEVWMTPWPRNLASTETVPGPMLEPMEVAGSDGQEMVQAKHKLIELGYGTVEGGRFKVSVAEADDAGHSQVLRQAGFSEQQLRNAQESQREAYEEANANVWFQRTAELMALARLRSLGFVDDSGRVNVAEADDAGFRVVLLGAGFTELQIHDAQRRQRQAYEEATHELWFQQLAETQKKQLDNSK